MTPVDWPVGVPSCVQPTSVQGGLRDNRYSFETDDKIAPIERPISSWTPEVYSVELTQLSIDQFKLFQNWYKETLDFGVRPFNWEHPITKEPSVWKILKSDPPYNVSKTGLIPNGSGNRRISISFNIMSWPESSAT